LVLCGTQKLSLRWYASLVEREEEQLVKNLIRYGMAAAMVLATAMPAIAAQSWVVCVDQSKDVRFSTETNLVGTVTLPRFFVGAAPVYPASTVTTTATACTQAARSPRHRRKPLLEAPDRFPRYPSRSGSLLGHSGLSLPGRAIRISHGQDRKPILHTKPV
jgi:hypothetical protein